jgi:NTP pyrophosphatase (non-canonical NTP hydrolase)
MKPRRSIVNHDDLTFDRYSARAHEIAFYETGHVMPDVVYACLGMAGETGEALEKVKKLFRDHAGQWTPERRAAFVTELGDVLWYLNEAAIQAGSSLPEVARANLDKINGRLARGTLAGSGDNR